MKRSVLMIWITALLAIASVGMGLFGCSDDIILEPLPSLLGEYDGRYEFTTNLGEPNQSTDVHLIQWKFTESFYFVIDTTTPQQICTPSGEYILGNGVDFVEAEGRDGCSGIVASDEKNPRGVFSLRQPADSVILTQQLEGTGIRKNIILTPAE